MGSGRTKAEAIAAHKRYLIRKIDKHPMFLAMLVWELDGMVLGCPGCKTGSPCHGDNLLEVVKQYRYLYK